RPGRASGGPRAETACTTWSEKTRVTGTRNRTREDRPSRRGTSACPQPGPSPPVPGRGAPDVARTPVHKPFAIAPETLRRRLTNLYLRWCRRDRAGCRGYCGAMRYRDGGGVAAAGRARREKVRLQAAEWFAEGVTPPEVARRLRVSCNSAYVGRRRWRAGGRAALASGGPGGAVCRLSGARPARLRAALEAGPALWGWAEDQRWTLERVSALIGRLFHVSYTVRGISYLLHRLGFTPRSEEHTSELQSLTNLVCRLLLRKKNNITTT